MAVERFQGLVRWSVCVALWLGGCPSDGGDSGAGSGGASGAAGAAGAAGMAGTGGTGATGGTGGTGGGSAPGCELPDGAGTEPVSFRNDVLPIFGLSCAIGPCHGAMEKEANLFLAPACKYNAATMKCEFAAPGTEPLPGQDELTDEVVAQILANLVGVPSGTIGSVERVKAGAPMESFLIQKVTDQQNALGHVGCVKQFADAMGECGDAMPPTGQALCEQKGGPERVALIARWIAQGALDN